MSDELYYLVIVSLFTAVIWVPYILDELLKNRITDAVGYGTPLVLSPWAERLKKAHYNAIENLVPFAALVLVADAQEISNAATVSAAATFFWARVVHAVAYLFAIPWVRTLAFLVGWGAIVCIAWQVLAA